MSPNSYRQIVRFAMENEVEARNFYRDAAKKLKDPGLKDIFAGLAEEEQRHFDTLQNLLKSEAAVQTLGQAIDYGLSETVDAPALSTDMKPAEAFALAMKKEEEAMRLYTRLAEAARDVAEQGIFRELAAMERSHKKKMEDAFINVGYPEVW